MIKRLSPLICILYSSLIFSQGTLVFPVNNINTLITNGTVHETHSQLDIGSITDVFDGDYQTLARTASINPQVVTLIFPFSVSFSGSEVLETYGDGWWSLEVADSEFDLDYQSGSYIQLLSMSPLTDGVVDSKSFPSQSKKIIRLTVHRSTGDDYVHLNEWKLTDATAQVEINSLCAHPSQLWMLPSTSLEVSVNGTDPLGFNYPIATDLEWTIENPDLISVESSGDKIFVLSNNTLGTTSLTVQWQGITQSIPIHVVDDFKPIIAPTRIVKVALVLIDPPIAAAGGLRFHERFGWDDPVHLTNAVMDSLDIASEGAVDYQVVATYDEPILYAALEGTVISVDSMYRLFLEPGWATFHHLEQTGGFAFDYNGLLDAHDFCTQSNNKEIDEIWVYSMPFTGMYESRLTGAGAFWYNSPPLDGNTCVDQIPIMGYNYERGVAEAMHSFGHRVESAMVHTFGRWDYNAVDKNDWEKFASYDKVVPGGANIGNIHYPPNAVSDYDYKNPTPVTTYADNWARYPFLFQDHRTVTCSEWDCSQLGFMSWWYHHLPHYTCKNKNGILNNWWPYIVDYNEGKALELAGSDCHCDYVANTTSVKNVNEELTLNLYPNPAKNNAILQFKGRAPEKLTANLFDQSGSKVRGFVIEKNTIQATLNLRNLSPGLYTLTLVNSVNIVQAKKQLIIAGN